jgi:protein-disulfide isomerase
VKYALFDLPLESLHGMAFRAAVAMRCAAEEGKYWEMRDRLFANPQTLDQTTAHAQAVGLDPSKFSACVGSGKFDQAIRQDMAQAEKAGMTGTPSFLLATTDEHGRLKGQRVIRGAQPFANFKAQIDAALAGQ